MASIVIGGISIYFTIMIFACTSIFLIAKLLGVKAQDLEEPN